MGKQEAKEEAAETFWGIIGDFLDVISCLAWPVAFIIGIWFLTWVLTIFDTSQM